MAIVYLIAAGLTHYLLDCCWSHYEARKRLDASTAIGDTVCWGPQQRYHNTSPRVVFTGLLLRGSDKQLSEIVVIMKFVLSWTVA